MLAVSIISIKSSPILYFRYLFKLFPLNLGMSSDAENTKAANADKQVNVKDQPSSEFLTSDIDG